MLISVIIPCRNEEKNITSCIDAIFNSELEDHDEIEILVVDGLSDDGTLDVIKSLQEKYKTLKLVVNEQKVTPVAFNLGIKAGLGEFIQIIGARQIISTNYLKLAKATLVENQDTWCVGGSVENIYETKESEIIGLAMSSAFGVGAGNFRIAKKSTYTETVGTPMYKKSVFDEIGYFNEDLVRNQDDEFNFRVINAGGKIFLNADILIKYYVRASYKKLYKQYMQYGYWKVYVNQLHKTVTSIRQLIPLFFVLGIVLGLGLSLFLPVFGIVYGLGLLMYVFLGLFFGVKISSGDLVKGVKVALVFPILHWSYGYGYLKGILDFLILRKSPSSKSKQLSR